MIRHIQHDSWKERFFEKNMLLSAVMLNIGGCLSIGGASGIFRVGKGCNVY